MKKNIALIAGGNSGEYVISIKSAELTRKNIDPDLYNVYTILIYGGKWIYKIKDNTEIPVDKNDFSITVKGNKINFDCAFIVIHGTPGEDGKLQGYFNLLNIPYTTSDLLTSAMTFNKNICNTLVNSYGILTAKSMLIKKTDSIIIEDILSRIALPCFVKPNKGGSSIGMSKIYKSKGIKNAVDIAFKEDDEVLIEEFIDGTELTCGVLKTDNNLIILPLTEIVSKNIFFDYEAKYTTGITDEITPARVSEKIEKQCKNTSAYLYDKLNCKGIVRFDYILSKNKLYFLEVNIVPGLSEKSIVPQQAKAMGIPIKQLFTMVIEESLKK
jgi:D-alanine-D-alanine ligase